MNFVVKRRVFTQTALEGPAGVCLSYELDLDGSYAIGASAPCLLEWCPAGAAVPTLDTTPYRFRKANWNTDECSNRRFCADDPPIGFVDGRSDESSTDTFAPTTAART